ncbi:hypothetical protein IG631_12815 [Alternaria alternata]|nr:hypothetical protein IG631_12815 [Alternaria alternata]
MSYLYRFRILTFGHAPRATRRGDLETSQIWKRTLALSQNQKAPTSAYAFAQPYQVSFPTPTKPHTSQICQHCRRSTISMDVSVVDSEQAKCYDSREPTSWPIY